MTDYELWNHFTATGQMSNAWWYAVAVLPATIIAGCTFLLMWFALRRVDKLPIMFLWLVIASVPLVLVLPSFYTNTSLTAALARVSFQPPANPQLISHATNLQIGRYLSQVATLGIIGASLSIIVIFAALLIGGYAPQPVLQAVQSISQSFTKAMTRAFGNRGGERTVRASKYGMVKVLRGQQQGTQYGVINGALIGKAEATMTIVDPVVSRRHARFELRNDQPYIIDENSTNGTYIRRNGTVQELNGQAVLLQHGDRIFLGPPDEPESVELLFEKPVSGGA